MLTYVTMSMLFLPNASKHDVESNPLNIHSNRGEICGLWDQTHIILLLSIEIRIPIPTGSHMYIVHLHPPTSVYGSHTHHSCMIIFSTNYDNMWTAQIHTYAHTNLYAVCTVVYKYANYYHFSTASDHKKKIVQLVTLTQYGVHWFGCQKKISCMVININTASLPLSG